MKKVDFTNKHWGFAMKHEFGDSCSWAASQKKNVILLCPIARWNLLVRSRELWRARKKYSEMVNYAWPHLNRYLPKTLQNQTPKRR